MLRKNFSYNDGMHNHEVNIRKRDNKFTITIDGFPYVVEQVKQLDGGQIEFVLDGKFFRCIVSHEDNKRYIFLDGLAYKLTHEENITTLSTPIDVGADNVLAPMPGIIIKVLVTEGDQISANQKVVILEAMKMQNSLVAPFAGKVIKILVKEGDQVDEGDLLVDIQPDSKPKSK